ncbi:hypothetical protein [Laceyella putida]|uniref:Uncharacterized protein n=1 Tax=Laceyella putida TaxID=110101 RepID=A0ABW2RFB1_9BACL
MERTVLRDMVALRSSLLQLVSVEEGVFGAFFLLVSIIPANSPSRCNSH